MSLESCDCHLFLQYETCVTTCALEHLQVNPLAEDADGNLIAADAKLGFDDNANYRQKEIFAMKDESQIDPRWLQPVHCGILKHLITVT